MRSRTGPGRGDRTSGARAQAEPLTALVAVSVVAIALALYAGAFETSLPGEADRDLAEPTADRVERAVTDGGVVDPGTDPLQGALAVGPDGYETNVTLVVNGDRSAVGPARPSTADVATRQVSVRVAPGRASPGRLEVAVWT